MEQQKAQMFFNPDEIFELAEQIERNGAAFYLQAAEMAKSEEARQVLNRLAAQEVEHELTFAKLRQELVAKQDRLAGYDQDSTAARYIQTIAGRYVFTKLDEPQKLLRGDESLPEILKIAIDHERESIMFYIGLVGLLKGDEDRERIWHIIREEQEHLVSLQEKVGSV